MKKYILLLLFLSGYAAYGQSVLPYHLTWSGLPFGMSYSKAEKMSATSFYCSKDLKRSKNPKYGNIHFDSLGRAISANDRQDDAIQTACWGYLDDGCPILVDCENGFPLKKERSLFSCQQGQIDTLFY